VIGSFVGIPRGESAVIVTFLLSVVQSGEKTEIKRFAMRS